MVKFIAQQTTAQPKVQVIEVDTDDDDDDDIEDVFDKFIYSELWDVDTDLITHEDDQEQVLILFGYISALRKVAEEVFGYATDTLDSLTPNYVSLAKETKA